MTEAIKLIYPLKGYYYINPVLSLKPLLGQKRYYSTKRIDSTNLDPWFITVFTDGEGCFSLTVRKNPKWNCGWESSAFFTIGVDKKYKDLLNAIQSYFGVGQVVKGEKNVYRYMVRRFNDLNIIIDHFNKYPWITQKHSDF